ncbi:hypothetical protein VULLAG_LOCUS4868 [Vulpes lagopus]
MCCSSHLTQWSIWHQTLSTEPPQAPSSTPTVGHAAPSASEVMEPFPAAGAEGFACAVMQGAESKTRYMVVRLLNHCSDLEEPRVPLGVLEPEQAPPSAITLIDVLEQPPQSVEQPAGPRALNHLKRPPKFQMWGLLHFLGLRCWIRSRLLELSTWPER